MGDTFPNLLQMDIEEFEEFITHKRERSKSPLQLKKLSPGHIELDDLEKRLEAAKKQAEDAQRDDCTILVLRLHIKANEKDIYSFFSAAAVGKIRDIQLIRDPKTGSGKGVAYVEFYTPDAVLKSMALSGQQINGQSISIQHSQAEKNRAANAAKMAKTAEQQLRLPTEGTNKIYVAGWKSDSKKIGPAELRQLFSPFGEIEGVEVNRGVGYVQYTRGRDAKVAVHKMDGADWKGRRLRVGMADTKASIKEAQRIGDHEEDGTYISGSGQRASIMTGLTRKHR